MIFDLWWKAQKKKLARQHAPSQAFWYREHWGLSAKDPRFLESSDIDIEFDYLQHKYLEDMKQGGIDSQGRLLSHYETDYDDDDLTSPDFDLASILAQAPSWEELTGGVVDTTDSEVKRANDLLKAQQGLAGAGVPFMGSAFTELEGEQMDDGSMVYVIEGDEVDPEEMLRSLGQPLP